MEAVDDRNVIKVIVACQTIEARTGIEIPEIWNELREYERKPYAQRLLGRGIEKLRPKDAAAARQALYAIIDRATAQIAVKAEAHGVRAELSGSLAADRLAFDDSPEAERLRRFDLACGRGLARSLESLIKLRRAPELADCSSSVLPAACDTHEPSATPNETNEPTLDGENVTNEPIDALRRERGDLKRSRIKIKSRIKNKDRRPTVEREIVTNEPTDAREIVTNSLPDLRKRDERTHRRPRKRDERTHRRPRKRDEQTTDGCENVANEPTVDREIVANGPLLAADVRLESLTYANSSAVSVIH